MSTLVILFLAHAALADPHHAQPSPPHRAVPISFAHGAHPAHSAHPVPQGSHQAHRVAATHVARAIARQSFASNRRRSGPYHHRHRHHHHRGEWGGAYYPEEGYLVGGDVEVDDSDGAIEAWDQPVDDGDSQASSPDDSDDGDEPEEAAPLPEPPPPPAPVDCDGGATDFQVDDGSGQPAMYRWVGRDGNVNYSDASSVPDYAWPTAKKTSGEAIDIEPRAACQPRPQAGN